MKRTVTEHNFRESFQRAGRGDSFTHEGLSHLFEYLEELESDCDMEIELDPIALCCDYAEYDSVVGAATEHGWEPDDPELLSKDSAWANEELLESALEWLQYRTTVINWDTGCIIQSF